MTTTKTSGRSSMGRVDPRDREDYRRAGELYANHQLAAALDLYRDLAERRLEARLAGDAPWGEADLQILERLAETASLVGQSAAAERFLAAGALICRREGHRPGEDWLTVQRSQLLLGLGRVDEAGQALDSVAPRLAQWRRRGDHGLLASYHWTRGRLEASEGFYEQALEELRQAERHQELDEPAAAAKLAPLIEIERIGIWLGRGELDLAAKGLSKRIDDPTLDLQLVNRLAQWNLLRGELGEALCSFEAIEDRCRELELGAALRRATLNTAHLLIELNLTVEAERRLARVAEAAVRTSDSAAATRARLLLAVSQSRRQGFPLAPSVSPGSGRRAAAQEPASCRPLELPRPLDFLALFEQRCLAIHWFLFEHRTAAAAEVLHQAELVFGRSDSRLVQLRLGILRGTVAHAQDDPESAARALEPAIEGLLELGVVGGLVEPMELLAKSREALGQGARSWRQKARQLAERLAESLPPEYRALYTSHRWTLEEKTLADEISRLARLRRRELGGSWLRRLGARWRRLVALDRFLYRLAALRERSFVASLRAAPTSGDRPGSLPSVLRRLLRHPLRRVRVIFVCLPDRTVVIRAGWLDLELAVSPLTRHQLRHLVGSLHRTLGASPGARNLSLGAGEPADVSVPRDAPRDATRSTIARRLSELLLLPQLLRGLPARVNALTFVPDDVLHGFPFAAVPCPEAEVRWRLPWRPRQGRHLGTRYRLNIDLLDDTTPTPSRSPWKRMRDLWRGVFSGARAGLRRALIVGVGRAIPADREGPGADEIPEARQEQEEIASWAESMGYACDGLLDHQASREAICRRLPRSQLWHIACHGVFVHDSPERTGLLLTPGEGRREVLSLRDLANLDLRSLEHATLSSCWGADNFILPSRTILSLPNTLRRRGAGSVLANLWPLDDEVAARLMRDFYRHLKRHPRDEALRRARLACFESWKTETSEHGEKDRGEHADGRPLDTSSPYFWAGLNLYGETRRLPGKTAS